MGVWFGCLRGWVCCGAYLWVSGRWFCGVVAVVLVLVCCLELFCLVGFVATCYGVVVAFGLNSGLRLVWIGLLLGYRFSTCCLFVFRGVVLLRCGFGLDSAVCSWFFLGVWVLAISVVVGRLLRLFRMRICCLCDCDDLVAWVGSWCLGFLGFV